MTLDKQEKRGGQQEWLGSPLLYEFHLAPLRVPRTWERTNESKTGSSSLGCIHQGSQEGHSRCPS